MSKSNVVLLIFYRVLASLTGMKTQVPLKMMMTLMWMIKMMRKRRRKMKRSNEKMRWAIVMSNF